LQFTSRQLVLKSLGTSLVLPWLPSIQAKEAQKTNSSTHSQNHQKGLKRFVAIGNLLGFQQKSFFPKTPGKNYESTTLLKPLEANRQHMTVYQGLDHGVKGGHFAVHTFLSGVLNHQAQEMPDGNVSLDQFIAEAIGTQTRFPSLTVGSEGGIHGGCQIAWTRSGIRVPPITEPSKLFDKLFINETPERQKQTVRQNRLQGSILDAISKDAKRLSKVVNSEDRNKLDEYFTSIRDVEKRLAMRKRWTKEPKPNAPFEKPADYNTVENLPMLYELIALALQTNSTRVATLEVGGCFLPQHLGIDRSYHSMSHHGNDKETIAHLIKLENYQIEHFGKFLKRLEEMQDGENSLLNSTAVLFGSGMGNAHSHINSDLPIILAGGSYQHGTFKKVSNKKHNKIPLCNLYLDIAQRMGMDAESFGTSTGTFS
jgi:hypothetical protein